jgi:hypothetical protein
VIVPALLFALAAVASIGPVSGDFNHDGARDAGRLVRNGDAFEIVIETGPRHRRVLIDRRHFSDPFLERSEYRGRVKTACGKGSNLDCAGVPDTVTLRGGELMYGQRESTSFVVIWTGGRFRSIQLSD